MNGFVQALYLSALLGVAGVVAAQDNQIIVQALDGRNGKPLANQRLLVFGGETPEAVRQQKQHYEIKTDKEGLATLTLGTDTQWLQVWPDWHVLCQSDPNTKSFAVAEILSSGVSTPNKCSSLWRKAMPGHLVVFARPGHLREKMRQ